MDSYGLSNQQAALNMGGNMNNDPMKNAGFMKVGGAFMPAGGAPGGAGLMGSKTQDPLIMAEAEKKLKQHR